MWLWILEVWTAANWLFAGYLAAIPGNTPGRRLPFRCSSPTVSNSGSLERRQWTWKRSVFIQLQKKARPQGDHQAGVRAEEYFTYCEEVGCDVWGLLASMDSLRGEPVCLWMKPPYQKPGTSSYVQGVEAPADYNGPVPETEYLVFQGEPFREEDYAQAILAVEWAMEKYDPALIGRQWDDKEPRIQLEPRVQRGYIELRAVRPL